MSNKNDDTPRKLEPQDGQDVFEVKCHCGNVRGHFICPSDVVKAIHCNCSDCHMRQNTHLSIPPNDFVVDINGQEQLEDVTTLYQWGTKTTVRRFCKNCGVLPWYRPRTDPSIFGVTTHCVDWTKGGTREPPKLDIHEFDGVHWEEAAEKAKASK